MRKNLSLDSAAQLSKQNTIIFTWMTLIGNPVARANCSLTCLVGFGVWLNASLSTSNSLALIVVLGPRLFPLSSTWEGVWNFINKKIWPKIVWQVFRYFPMKEFELFNWVLEIQTWSKLYLLIFAIKWAKIRGILRLHCIP